MPKLKKLRAKKGFTKHKTRKSALDESERLAKLFPGQEFYVLEAITMTTCPLTPPQSFGLIDTTNYKNDL